MLGISDDFVSVAATICIMLFVCTIQYNPIHGRVCYTIVIR